MIVVHHAQGVNEQTNQHDQTNGTQTKWIFDGHKKATNEDINWQTMAKQDHTRYLGS